MIDDHYLFRKGIAELITRKSDYKITAEAGTPEEADKILKDFTDTQNPEDIVIALVDISFKCTESNHEKNYGFEIVKKINQRCPSIKCIMLSSYDTSGYVQKALSAEVGAMGYVSKAADESILLEALDSVANGKTYIQQNLIGDPLELKDLLASLTRKEREVTDLLSMENTNTEIAEKMGITVSTVENYISRLYDKTGTSSRIMLLEKLGKL